MAEKRAKPEGSPQYMGLFTSLMTVLLAFFIILNSMADVQESGFNSGIGDVKNAFGLTGGVGIMKFNLRIVGNGVIKEAAEHMDPYGEVGFHEETMKGEGGPGNIDQPIEDFNKAIYLRIKIPYKFQKGSYSISTEMAGFFDLVGMGFELFDLKFDVRVFCKENRLDKTIPKIEAIKADETLAIKRAFFILLYMQQDSGISYQKMNAIGYGNTRYFHEGEKETIAIKDDQAAYFYVFFDKKDK